ncbi:MAG TPA: BON domain-containing protein [Streptosporangiaceae bacterium]|nr:BON domain-containing protein [Streptosporangiaceae bacterium]
MSASGDIRAAVSEELRADPLVDTDDIEVRVLGGDVSLNGTVPSQAQRSGAAQAARRAGGVSTVHNLLEVALPAQDWADDNALGELVNQALAADAAVPDGIRAGVLGGHVVLAGYVSSAAERMAAENAAAGCGGVLSVFNKIVVATGRPA